MKKIIIIIFLYLWLPVSAQNLGMVDNISTRNQQTRSIQNKTFENVDNAIVDTLFDLDWDIGAGYSTGTPNTRAAYKQSRCGTFIKTFDLYTFSAVINKRNDSIQLRLNISPSNCKVSQSENDQIYKDFWILLSKNLFIQDLSIQQSELR